MGELATASPVGAPNFWASESLSAVLARALPHAPPGAPKTQRSEKQRQPWPRTLPAQGRGRRQPAEPGREPRKDGVQGRRLNACPRGSAAMAGEERALAQPHRSSGSREPGGDAPGSRWGRKGSTHPPLRGSQSSAPRPRSSALARTPPRLLAAGQPRLRRPPSSRARPRLRHDCSLRRPPPPPPLPWPAFSASFEAVAASRRRSVPPPRRRAP